MAGFDNDVIYGTNIDLSNSLAGQGGNATLLTDGQMLIASTALNAGGTHVNVGVITSPLGTLAIGYNSPNITMDLVGGITAVEHLTGDSGGTLNPDGANNFNLLGQQAGTIAVMDTIGSGSTLRFENRAWQTKFVVDASSTVGLRGTYTTIQAAVTAASAGDTVFVRAGTYTENIALKAGVNITGLLTDGTRGLFVQSQFTPTVKIIGKMTFSSAGSVDIANVFLQTNADFLLEVTGSAASYVAIQNSYIYCSNNTGISSTSTSSAINFTDCDGDLGTTGIAYFALSGGGNLAIRGGRWANSGASVTNSTWTNGILSLLNCEFNSYVTSSTAAAGLGANFANVWFNGDGNNATVITHGNTAASGITVRDCTITSGSASAISVSVGALLYIYNSNLKSSNTNVITGAGTLNYADLTFYGTSSGMNVTTQTAITQGTGSLKFFTASGTTGSSTTNIMTVYEEGTFTPTLIGGSTAGVTTYSNQVGYYTKIGNLCYVAIVIVISAATGTGNATFGGLPFTVKANNPNGYCGTVNINSSAWAWPASTVAPILRFTQATSTALITLTASTIGSASLQMTNGAATFVLSGFYQV